MGTCRRLVAVLCLFAIAAGVVNAVIGPIGRVAYEDRNRDGRIDVWQYYDRHGHLDSVFRDTNFDGRVDAVEDYRANRLVRRERDRDFDHRIDVVEEFDSASQTRTTTDLDGDGVADALVLSIDAHGVDVRWAARAGDARAIPAGGFAPAPLIDPFSQVPGFRADVPRDDDLTFTTDASANIPVDILLRYEPASCGLARVHAVARASSNVSSANADRAPPALAI